MVILQKIPGKSWRSFWCNLPTYIEIPVISWGMSYKNAYEFLMMQPGKNVIAECTDSHINAEGILVERLEEFPWGWWKLSCRIPSHCTPGGNTVELLKFLNNCCRDSRGNAVVDVPAFLLSVPLSFLACVAEIVQASQRNCGRNSRRNILFSLNPYRIHRVHKVFFSFFLKFLFWLRATWRFAT